MLIQVLFPSQIMEPDSPEAEKPSKQESVNSVPVGLRSVGERLAEFSMLNGPLHMLAERLHEKYVLISAKIY